MRIYDDKFHIERVLFNSKAERLIVFSEPWNFNPLKDLHELLYYLFLYLSEVCNFLDLLATFPARQVHRNHQ